MAVSLTFYPFYETGTAAAPKRHAQDAPAHDGARVAGSIQSGFALISLPLTAPAPGPPADAPHNEQ